MAATYRVGVIGRTGKGDYGHNLDLGWKDFPQTTVVAVADDNPSGLASAAKRHPGAKAYSDYRQMLDEAKPDIGNICQRWIDRHAEMAIACLERGIHVYMEKPLCRDLAEADAIVAASDKTHARLALAHPTRYSPLWPTVRELIKSGKIGPILELRARGKEDPRGGGEDLWVLGSHPLDMILDLAGPADSCMAVIEQDGRRAEPRDVHDGPEGLGPLVGDRIQAQFHHPSGPYSFFASKRGAGRKESRFALQIFGADGVIEIVQTQLMPTVNFLGDPSWSPGRSDAAWQRVSTAGIGKPEPLPMKGVNVGQGPAIRNLLECIESGKEPICGPRHARGIVELIFAVFAAHRAGKPVALPLKQTKHPLLA